MPRSSSPCPELSGIDGVTLRFVELDGVRLQVAQAGPSDGPLVILLHGFPEFWFEWRELIGPLAAAGYRVAAPDQRGYNRSSKPSGVDAYRLDRLAGDVLGLADRLGADTFRLVGHDWGASVAWWVATVAPERLEKLAVLNAPHPAVWLDAMTRDPAQRRKSRYVRALRTPWLPEALVRMGNYKGLADAFAGAARPAAFDPAAMARYHAAWRQPGALTATLNWYRALFRQPLSVPSPQSLATPTLILWGDQDAFAEPALAETCAALCSDVTVRHLPGASHWTPHDEPDVVCGALLGFLAG